MEARRSNRRWWFALGVVMLAGFALRAGNLDWDDGYTLHPDERHWAFILGDTSAPANPVEYFDTDASPLNPYAARPTFVYGTLPLFATKASAAALGTSVAAPLVDVADALGIDLLDEDGNAKFDTGFAGHLVGRLLSAIADTVTIGLVAVLGRLLAGRRAGLAAAVLYATCVTAIQHAHFLGADSWFAMFTTATTIAGVLAVRRSDPRWLLAAGALAGAAVACRVQGVVLVVAIAAVLVERVLRREVAARRAFGLGIGSAAIATVVFRIAQPYAFDGWGLNQQWVDDLREIRRLQSGVDFPPSLQWVGRTWLADPLGNLAVWGLGLPLVLLAVVGAVVLWQRRVEAAVVPAIVAGSFIALIATTWTPTIRYLLPVAPMAATAAGVGAVALWREATRANGPARVAVYATAIGLPALAIAWGLAFVNGVYGETHPRVEATEWFADHVAPDATVVVEAWDDAVPLRSGVYELEEINPYETDSADKMDRWAATIDRADLIVLSSQRAVDSVARLPARYPSTLRYYEALGDGSLGFDLVAEFRNEPSLLGVDIDTRSAEESFSVYDHPPVNVYAKSDRYDPVTTRVVLDPSLASTAIAPDLREGGANALLATPDERSTFETGPTFDDRFRRRAWGALALWLAGWSALTVAALGPSRRLAGGSPALTAALAPVLGPIAVTTACWTAVTIGPFALTDGLIRIVALVAIAGGGFLTWRDREGLAASWRTRRGAWLTVFGAAAAAFVAVLLTRFANPDLWHPFQGGEKPMELAYLSSIGRAASLPPADPWFAGGVMNYYYLGWFHLSLPMRAWSIVPEVAFAIGLATVAASAVGLATGAGYHLTERLRVHERPIGSSPGSRAAVIGGIGSGAALLVAGNLDAVRQLITGDAIDWWAVSRTHRGTLDITEFPAWSFLFGDLHPHVMGMWLTLLVIVAGLAYLDHSTARADRARPAIAALTGVTVATVAMTHTWDLPAAALIAGAAWAASRPWRIDRRRAALLDAAVAMGTAIVVIAPYRARQLVFNDGISAAPITTDLVDHLVHLGPWLLLVAGFAVSVVWRPMRTWTATAGRGVPALLAGVTAAALVGIGIVVSATFALSAAVVAVAVGATAVAFRGHRLATGVVAALGALAVGLAALPDLVIITPDIVRMNTVFKFTSQAWVIVAAVAGPAAVGLARAIRPSRAAPVVELTGTAIVAAMIFTGLAIVPGRLDVRVAEPVRTLDGIEYLHGDWSVGGPGGEPIVPPADRPLIDWLRAHAAGQPTVLEMTHPVAYGWNARMSAHTGLPTVIGWQWHQTQQRLAFSDVIRSRADAVDAFYRESDADQRARLLRAHRVDYVVVGTLERSIGSDAALDAILDLPGVSEVMRDGELFIATVDQDELAVAIAEASIAEPR